MAYQIREVFYTLQGEGAQSGRPAVFCRFAGCNLWSGREQDRSTAVCQFCDTQFVGTDGAGGGRFASAPQLADHIESFWPAGESRHRFTVLTGGEPLLQLDEALITQLHCRHFQIAVETNGTLAAPLGLDWICVSPKAGAAWVLRSGDELKLVYPQPGLMPQDIERDGAGADFRHWWLQPMDGPELSENTRRAVEHCLSEPRWRLSLQTHKFIGIA
jgi:7-carboxy-7-deazaguanine synthase (Cx14CxxC type)